MVTTVPAENNVQIVNKTDPVTGKVTQQVVQTVTDTTTGETTELPLKTSSGTSLHNPLYTFVDLTVIFKDEQLVIWLHMISRKRFSYYT